MFPIQIDFRSELPAYMQIVNQIKQQVATGMLQPGDQLPTVRRLAEELRLNFNTVARAYRVLDEANLISTQQGRGTYILAHESEEDGQRLRQQTIEALTRRYLYDGSRLGFAPHEMEQIFRRLLHEWQEGLPPVEPK
jgi:GntR family transcriptional regulator